MHNNITDVAGITVGHAVDVHGVTGCTVIVAKDGAVCGVDVRGSAPGTRETDALDPINGVEKVHAITLAGGSAFGLEAASCNELFGGAANWFICGGRYCTDCARRGYF